jgi:hypothetical protein
MKWKKGKKNTKRGCGLWRLRWLKPFGEPGSNSAVPGSIPASRSVSCGAAGGTMDVYEKQNCRMQGVCPSRVKIRKDNRNFPPIADSLFHYLRTHLPNFPQSPPSWQHLSFLRGVKRSSPPPSPIFARHPRINNISLSRQSLRPDAPARMPYIKSIPVSS